MRLDNAFWQFSIALYGAPGVEQACLELQDALDIDVNMLLFCAWLAVSGRAAVTASDITALTDLVRSWNDQAVRPLRAARRNIKSLPQALCDPVRELRRHIGETELQAERIEQAILFDHAERVGKKDAPRPLRDIVRDNLDLYLRIAARKRHSIDEQRPLSLLIEAAVAFRAPVGSE